MFCKHKGSLLSFEMENKVFFAAGAVKTQRHVNCRMVENTEKAAEGEDTGMFIFGQQ